MKIAINHQSPIPLHLQVEQFLRDLIQQDIYQSGELLPNEVELSTKFGISRNTFRKAMDKLVYEGLVVRKKGIGSRVNTSQKVSTALSEWSSFTQEMSSKGILFEDIGQTVQWIDPDPDVCALMQIDANTKIVRLDRVKGEQGVPVVYFKSYFHPQVKIKKDETFEGALYEILEKQYFRIPVESHEEIGAMMPDADLIKMLNISFKVPILYRQRLVYDGAGHLLELGYAYYCSDKFVYNINIKRELS